MKTSIWNGTRNLAIAMALAVVMILVLGWGIHCCVLPGVVAQSLSPQQTQLSADLAPLAWAPNQVFAQLYTSTEIVVWAIPSCNVVITFPKNLVGSDQYPEVVNFTFTTQSKQAFPAPLASLDAFFSLDGDYVLDALASGAVEIAPQDVSFNADKAPIIEWRYQDADLGPIQENSLRLYREWGVVGNQDWKEQKGWVDTNNNKAIFSLEQLDTFGFGGYHGRLYLPLTLNTMPSQ